MVSKVGTGLNCMVAWLRLVLPCKIQLLTQKHPFRGVSVHASQIPSILLIKNDFFRSLCGGYYAYIGKVYVGFVSGFYTAFSFQLG